jgi:hypothetical protein
MERGSGCGSFVDDVREAMSGLTPLEQLVLRARFGLAPEVAMPGEAMLSATSGNRWVETRALRKLRANGVGLRSPIPRRSDEIDKPANRRSVVTPLRRPMAPCSVPREPRREPDGANEIFWDEA